MPIQVVIPDATTFMSRAFAYDPLMLMSLLPPSKAKLGTVCLQASPQEDITMTANTTAACKLESESEGSESSDLDLLSSVVEEIEVCQSFCEGYHHFPPQSFLD